MPYWRCPHCNTPQPEASRCWLCGKVTTACLSCRHFRRGMAGGLALCGRNPRGPVLRGPEVMPCWDAVPQPATPASPATDGHLPVAARSTRTFVPVEEVVRPAENDALTLAAREAASIAGRAQPDWGWVLFAELEA
jgi:hypothetical protein